MCNLHQRELKTRGRKSRGGLCPFLAATVGEFYIFNCFIFFCGKMKQNTVELSSPRAESARAVTGRREDFLSRQQDFFTETAVTSERKVEKSFPRWEINRHGEG